MSLPDEKSILNIQQSEERLIHNISPNYNDVFDDEENENVVINGSLNTITSKRLVVMEYSKQIKEIHTILWDKTTSRPDFIYYADRIIRMVIEEGLNQLPFTECIVTTHTGVEYTGCSFYKGICGVSIVRSGEAMEKGLRECCRSIRIGKIILNRDEETGERSIIYARFPPDIYKRKVLLMYPILCTGGNVTLGVDSLVEYGVKEEDIYVLSLFATPESVDLLFGKHPNVLLLTTEINDNVPIRFGEQYYGTE